MDPCPFCEIVADPEKATIVREWPDAIAFLPLSPVVEDREHGHVLVVPRQHVRDFTVDPEVTAATSRRAAELGAQLAATFAAEPSVDNDDEGLNLISSAGAAATQTVPHLHEHVVYRRKGDRLPLPWTLAEQPPAEG